MSHPEFRVWLIFALLSLAARAETNPPDVKKPHTGDKPPNPRSSLSSKVVPIPEAWKNNPDFGVVYEVTGNVAGLKIGGRVILSRRSMDDILLRDETDRSIGICRLGDKNQDDGGICDTQVPYAALKELLKPTTEAAPMAHWEKWHADHLDPMIPNVKPNFYYHSTFPLNVHPASGPIEQRPNLILSGASFRVISPSPHCKPDELTIRLSEETAGSSYLAKRRAAHPEVIMAGPWYGDDYCLSVRRFVLNAAQENHEVDPKAKDILPWEDVSRLYSAHLPGAVASPTNDKAIPVDPFSEADRKRGRSGPTIKLKQITTIPETDRQGLADDTWVADYGGPLYYACAGGSCRMQGYQVALGPDGKILKVLKNHLYYWDGHAELPLDPKDWERLLKVANDKDQLRQVYDWAKGKQGPAFTAEMSRLAQMGAPRQAGNSFGTFLLHLSKIREKEPFKANGWPTYDGPAPGGDK